MTPDPPGFSRWISFAHDRHRVDFGPRHDHAARWRQRSATIVLQESRQRRLEPKWSEVARSAPIPAFLLGMLL